MCPAWFLFARHHPLQRTCAGAFGMGVAAPVGAEEPRPYLQAMGPQRPLAILSTIRRLDVVCRLGIVTGIIRRHSVVKMALVVLALDFVLRAATAFPTTAIISPLLWTGVVSRRRRGHRGLRHLEYAADSGAAGPFDSVTRKLGRLDMGLSGDRRTARIGHRMVWRRCIALGATPARPRAALPFWWTGAIDDAAHSACCYQTEPLLRRR